MVVPLLGRSIATFKHDELSSSDIQRLGRKTCEAFAAAWPSRTGDYADRLNASTKHVVSTTLRSVDGNNTHVIDGDVAKGVRAVKEQSHGDILVHGSRSLVQWLTREALVDEYRLRVYPLVLGSGLRLFEAGDPAKLKLTGSRVFDSGVTLLSYEPSPAAQ
jgi:dihydrofolate reductase